MKRPLRLEDDVLAIVLETILQNYALKLVILIVLLPSASPWLAHRIFFNNAIILLISNLIASMKCSRIPLSFPTEVQCCYYKVLSNWIHVRRHELSLSHSVRSQQSQVSTGARQGGESKG